MLQNSEHHFLLLGIYSFYPADYCDPKSGEAKRWRAAYMRRSMERFIGCDVDIYIWKEWEALVNAELTQAYVDTYSLDHV